MKPTYPRRLSSLINGSKPGNKTPSESNGSQNTSDLYLRPPPVLSGKLERVLEINKLNQAQKLILWKHLKQNHPKKAEEISIVMKDPLLLSLIERFSGSLVIEMKFVPGKLHGLIE